MRECEPAAEGVCDVCAGQLVSRPDDNEEAITKRLADFHDKTAPVLELFRQKELVVTADGTLDPQAVQASIRRALGLAAGA